MLTGTSTSSPYRGPSRTSSRVPSISEEAVSPLPARVGGVHHGGRRGATMPVSSLLEALNEGNERTEPETFEASLMLIYYAPSGVQLRAALCPWKHAAFLWACCLLLPLAVLGMLPFPSFGFVGHAAFTYLVFPPACCLSLPLVVLSMLPLPTLCSLQHAAFCCLWWSWACCLSLPCVPFSMLSLPAIGFPRHASFPYLVFPLACCLSLPSVVLSMLPLPTLCSLQHAAFGGVGHAAFAYLVCPPGCCLWWPWACCLSLPCVLFSTLPFPAFGAFEHAAFPFLVFPPACCLSLQEAQLGIRRTSTIPVRFKQMVSDCLSPTNSLKPSKHHKLSEVDVDTPPARPMSDPALDQGEEEEVQSSRQQPGIIDGQSQAKRLRVAPAVRYMRAV